MRRIYTINGPPKSFVNWLQKNQPEITKKLRDDNCSGTDIWDYFRENSEVYKELKETLVRDQGYICCYCGQRIGNDFHTSIEHLYPKDSFKELTLEFENLLASCKGGSQFKIHVVKEGENLEVIAKKYGVDREYLEDVYVNLNEIEILKKKYDIENLRKNDRIVIIPKLQSEEQHCDARKGKKTIDIHPLQNSCQGKFQFNYSGGKIIVTKENKSTICTLGLNNNMLINRLREKKLEDVLLLKENLIRDFEDNPELFNQGLNKLTKEYDLYYSTTGELEPFSFVILWGLRN